MSLLTALGLKPRPQFKAAPSALAPPEQPTDGPAGTGNAGGINDAAGPRSTSAAPLAELLSIEITPKVTTIDGEGELALTATGVYADGSRHDLSFDVDWDSDNPSAVAVNASGLAQGRAVSDKATITATEPDSGKSGSITLEVVHLPRYGPDRAPELKSIEIVPPRVQAFVNTSVNWTAIGEYDNGARRNLTEQVRWASSDKKVASFDPPLLPGACYAFAKGNATITATDAAGKVKSKPSTLAVVERPKPPPPPKWLEKVEISFARPGGGYQWVVGERFSMMAKGTYSDGTTPDITKQVQWWTEPAGVAKIDASGAVSVLAMGSTIVHANWEKLGKGWPDNNRYFRVDVLAAAPKAAPKVPATGKLTKASALALARSLAGLSKYRHESDAAKTSIKAETTGDKQLDTLLELVADVVRKWGTKATILEARQAWAAVMPRLLALLKEAVAAPSSLQDNDLNSARNAINDMHAWVNSDPGSRSLQNNYVNKVTPFGSLSIAVPFLPGDGGQYGADDVVTMLGEYDEARAQGKKLAEAMRALEAKGAQVRKAAGDAAKLEKEVTSRTGEKASNESKHYAAAVRDLKIVQLSLRSFVKRLEDAKVQVQLAFSGEWAAQANATALKELRELAEDQGKGIDAALGIAKLGASVALTGPIGLLEVADVVKDLRGVLESIDLQGRARKAVDRAASLGVQQAKDILVQAQVNLGEAEALLNEAAATLGEVDQDFVVLRDDAEAAYDRNASGFSFKQLREAIDDADAARSICDRALYLSRRTRNASAYFADQVDLFKRPRFDGEGDRILLAISKDAGTTVGTVEKLAARVAVLKTGFASIRSTAHRAMFTAQGAKRGKSQPAPARGQ